MLPREKLLSHGASSLSDTELLALFLHTGTKEMNVLQLSDLMLKQFGSLRGLLLAEQHALCSVKGIGIAKFVQLQAIHQFIERYLAQSIDLGKFYTSSEEVKKYLISKLRDKKREVFAVLLLNNQHQIISYHQLFEGTINSATVYPREIIKLSLEKNAAAVILAHNHPSGIAEPSQADRRITKTIIDALLLVEIRVLDHFVVGEGKVVSFAERGWV
ncbi:DNA repair protein RadC [Vibrio sp. SS-MA-C1-2]|nr:DNA repair protein RadC [Vibrio sp. SS-MA-C1-2]